MSDDQLKRVSATIPYPATHQIDLRGLGEEEARFALAKGLKELPPATAAEVSLSPAVGDGTLTLFQPVGRTLLKLKRLGHLHRLVTLSDGLGFWIVTPR